MRGWGLRFEALRLGVGAVSQTNRFCVLNDVVGGDEELYGCEAKEGKEKQQQQQQQQQ